MTSPRELFKEFIQISYNPDFTWHSDLRDLSIGSGAIARVGNSGIKVHYLTSGSRITIPKEYILLFEQLNVSYGDRILYINRLNKKDTISKFIYKFLRLLLYLNASRGKDFIDTLLEICEIGSQEFRDWVWSNFKINLRPLEFNSLEKDLKL